MAKANKKAKQPPNGAAPKNRTPRPDPLRLQKLFAIARRSGNPNPVTPRFSKTNQPKRRPGRPPGTENFLTKEIKTAAVTAATMYGLDGTGLGGLTGYFYRGCDMQMANMISLLGRICPMQKGDAPVKQEETYKTVEEFDAALKARGLPTLSHVLALQYDHSDDPRFANLDLTAEHPFTSSENKEQP